jgi:hypothetical protein
MVEGLNDLLNGGQADGLAELRQLPEELLGGGGAVRLAGAQRLAPWVYRLHVEGGCPGSVVVKRLDPGAARRNELAACKWLPALGLAEAGPPLQRIAPDPGGRYVWHVYEDLGPQTLDENAPDPGRVAAVVDLLARLHTRSAGHSLLPECRRHGGDLGIAFYTSSVRGAIGALEALRAPDVELSPDRQALRDRLLGRLYRLADEAPRRATALRQLGGPDALLHGDLWPKNALALPAGAGFRVRLIDWDRAGAGPVSYDLSTFLGRFPPGARPWALDLYRQAVGRFGWRLPGRADLNLLFDTAERARLANCVIWRALAVREGHAEWGFQELAALDQWLEELQPVLREGGV